VLIQSQSGSNAPWQTIAYGEDGTYADNGLLSCLNYNFRLLVMFENGTAGVSNACTYTVPLLRSISITWTGENGKGIFIGQQYVLAFANPNFAGLSYELWTSWYDSEYEWKTSTFNINVFGFSLFSVGKKCKYGLD